MKAREQMNEQEKPDRLARIALLPDELSRAVIALQLELPERVWPFEELMASKRRRDRGAT